jgi:hypothetical protein
MRVVKILSGLSVLFTTFAFAQILRHNLLQHLEFIQHLDSIHASHEQAHNPSFVAVFLTGATIVLFSFVGGCLLFRRDR